jgi:hypothetical protein
MGLNAPYDEGVDGVNGGGLVTGVETPGDNTLPEEVATVSRISSLVAGLMSSGRVGAAVGKAAACCACACSCCTVKGFGRAYS